MKTVRHTTIARCTIATLLLFGAVACDDQSVMSPETKVQQTEQVSRLQVTADLVTLKAGETAEIHLAAASSSEERLVWSSDDATIAEVDDTGLIVAHSAGTTTITVSEAGKVTDVLVTVLPADSTGAGL